MERLKGYTTLPFHSTLRVLHLQVESALSNINVLKITKECHDEETENDDDGRQHGGSLRCVSLHGGCRDIPDHAVVANG
ncbi:hypothetical protein KL86DPRO_30040 [uncultured delta proteobacterium]|uniref:Uncharacterized protein n=1 Tax=uncultured delta proteobacterium TaxID=34034 RepID=A0A212K6V3_9DELT|nr:hypothetical protein KL86DPRO_30040 [uncultured delta proteobacterium]